MKQKDYQMRLILRTKDLKNALDERTITKKS